MSESADYLHVFLYEKVYHQSYHQASEECHHAYEEEKNSKAALWLMWRLVNYLEMVS